MRKISISHEKRHLFHTTHKINLNRSHVYDSYDADIYKLHEMLRRKILMALEQAKVSGQNEKPEIPRK